jgi:hypothetical protein
MRQRLGRTDLGSTIVEVGIELVDDGSKLVDRSHTNIIGGVNQEANDIDCPAKPYPAKQSVGGGGVGLSGTFRHLLPSIGVYDAATQKRQPVDASITWLL